MFLVLQTASSPSFAQKSVREESIWVAKSRIAKARSQSTRVEKNRGNVYNSNPILGAKKRTKAT